MLQRPMPQGQKSQGWTFNRWWEIVSVVAPQLEPMSKYKLYTRTCVRPHTQTQTCSALSEQAYIVL